MKNDTDEITKAENEIREKTASLVYRQIMRQRENEEFSSKMTIIVFVVVSIISIVLIALGVK